ncbi:MAG TPA: O-antigen ligase family protein [Bacteroidia bacterium]|nr:O-antigen ligase family protein [Bacteroidia bacterium]
MLKERVNVANYYLLCLLALFPVFSMKVTVMIIIAFTVVSVLSGLIWGLEKIEKKQVREAVLLLSPFILIFIRTAVMDRSDSALFVLETSLSLFAFPLAFFLSPLRIRKEQLDRVNLLFCLATIFTILFAQVKAAFTFSKLIGNDKSWHNVSDMLHDPTFPFQFRTLFEEYVNMHPTYAGIFLGITILLLLDRFFKGFDENRFGKGVNLLILFAIVLSVFMQGMLASRTPILATLLCAGLLFFIHQRRKRTAIMVLVLMFILSLIMIWKVPYFSSRFKEISVSNTKIAEGDQDNSVNIRAGIFHCSSKIIKENWLFGVGPGNIRTELNNCYTSISKEDYIKNNYNTHNQFMDFWAGLGILGPISLLLILIYISYKSVRQKNPLVLCIALFFLISMQTENVLNRQNGIVVFAYFISLYFFTPGIKDEQKSD